MTAWGHRGKKQVSLNEDVTGRWGAFTERTSFVSHPQTSPPKVTHRSRPAKKRPSRPRGKKAAKKKRGSEPVVSHLTPILHDVAETMELLKIGRTTLWNLTVDGTLRSVKIGARCLYRREDIERFIRRHVAKVAK